jgi:hypothetical protein
MENEGKLQKNQDMINELQDFIKEWKRHNNNQEGIGKQKVAGNSGKKLF